MPLKAVLFDLWETLIQDNPDRGRPRRAWRAEAVRGILLEHGYDATTEEVSAALDASSLALTALHDEGRDLNDEGRAALFFTHLEAKTNRRAPRAAGPELHEVIASMPLELAPHLAPYAQETLGELRALGVATALVSNVGMTTAPNLRRLLAHYGLGDLFDVFVFSDELLIAKPDPRIFSHALQGLACEADCSAFVGDNPHNDISGALAAGIYAVQIGAKVRDGIVPHARIDSLADLLPALEKRFFG
jgi:HAD superfamily hydrolase (TIGR01509 family)